MNYQEQHLALAGVCQSAKLVQSIARNGSADANAVEASISSILVTSPDNTQQVFGSLQNLAIGFQTLIAQLDSNNKHKDAELTRYIASILSLERKLSRHNSALNELAERVSHVQRQLGHVEFEHTQILTSLASIYSDVVSPLAAKIQVAGNPDYLSQTSNQKKVRALLLAGVRAAVLWRQLGGKRRQILFNRKTVVNGAKEALRTI
ncbi:high frequency lysogenization protein HflD [Glaciecola petra]|uniref:High frequency lysogenization protein HflD homolog n=1 Tax=Glaciecola petra TaxID=3075602 RepID=A0ABU2ZN23_9ALTE|nr:high frequency lysogenization protein HflD [Aestuariibacter sp. P117]MDT0594010.1 high frequency lysogenization protein HflD [Aestuariibacter sp. P117]